MTPRRDVPLALALGLTISLIGHYFFTSAISPRDLLDDAERFAARYAEGIFAYRILGREAVLWLNRVLFDGADLYAARAVLNTGALMAFNLVFLAVLRHFAVARRAECLLIVDAIVLMSLSVNANPYSVLSLALLYAAIWSIETDHPWLVLGLLVLGTLAHEASLFMLVYWVGRHGARRRAWTGTLALAWLATYVGLRVWIDQPTQLYGYLTGPAVNLSPKALVVVTLIGALYATFFNPRAPRHLVAFVLVAVPYYAYLFVIATWWELRLFLPFLPALVLMAHLPGRADAVGRRQPLA